MKEFIAQNLATILISTALLVIVVFVIAKIIKNKKNHKSICANCSNCSFVEKCSESK